MASEITVTPSTPMPKGYKLLRKGYPFMTALCRRKTLAAGRTLYVVRTGTRTLGLRAPRHIVDEVYKTENETRAARRAAVAARDESARSTFEEALRAQYPAMPNTDRERVLRRALQKHSGRVGRTATLRTEDKVRLAVAAHVRHMHTDYDRLVRDEDTSRAEARRAVYGSVREVLARWEGSRETERDVVREENVRIRRRPRTRADTRSDQSLLGVLDGDGKATTSSLDDPILISSDSGDGDVDVLIISSDEE